MKPLFILSIIAGVAANAQECSGYWYLKPNAVVVMSTLDRKGAENGTQTWKVTAVEKTGASVRSTVNASFTDSKGKVVSTTTGNYECNGGQLSCDIRMGMPQNPGQEYEADARMKPVYISYPAHMAVGDALPDAQLEMAVKTKSGLDADISMNMVNRKIAAQESVTTPAGTWTAYVITYDGAMKMKISGMGIPVNFSVKEWFVPGLGIVQSESYNKGGKLMGSSRLKSITP